MMSNSKKKPILNSLLLTIVLCLCFLSSCIGDKAVSKEELRVLNGSVVHEKFDNPRFDSYRLIIKVKGKKQKIQRDSFYYQSVIVTKELYDILEIGDTLEF